MNKLVRIATAAVGVLVVVATLAVVGYRQGWFGRGGLRAPGPSGGAGGPSAGQPAAPAAGGGAGGPSAEQPASPAAGGAATTPAGQPAPPQFDGNVAAIVWGGKVESATGFEADDEHLLNMIDEDEGTRWTSSYETGPKEIVLSFADHELVLIDQVKILGAAGWAPRDVEVWVSSSGPTDGFTRAATAQLPAEVEGIIRFDPVEARYVKLRLLHNQDGAEKFEVMEIRVMEAKRSGYTPLIARHPELNGPQPAGGGTAVAAAGAPPACVPLTPTTLTAGHGESKHVLVIESVGKKGYGATYLKSHPEDLHRSPDLGVVAAVNLTTVLAQSAAPWMLAPKYGYDTVAFEQVCPDHLTPPMIAFQKALLPWVAEGHKLIIHDADSCSGTDYAWLPYHFKTDNPGRQGAPGKFLRFTEENWMAHGRAGHPGFIDTAAWEEGTGDYSNELGDSNTLTEWDPHWCGHMAVRNVNNVFGFAHTYAHYGQGLIIYSGFDVDMADTLGYDLLLARELAQGFDPDNLPCAARIGDFVVTTDTRLMERPFLPGRSYDYPLSLLSNQGYKGTVSLSVKANPGLEGMQASFAPASVALDGLAESKFSLTLPANAPTKPQALEVKGIDTGGKANSLCLQLVQPTTGELTVVSTLARPPKARKNLEIILDASGSMKLPLGKKTRWTTAHDVLSQVLGKLPTDFNVGLRIYGHRESSRSPKTCTDSELVLPIQKLNPQAILSAAEAVKPRGETPLIYSVLQSITDLKDVGGGTVIVITDGEESCHGDPVKAAAELKASGLDIVLNIVGFTTGQAVRKQLGGFAQATGGRFYGADNGPTLARALEMAVVERFPYSVLDATGKEVAAGEAGAGAEELPPGEYTVVVTAGETSVKAEHVGVALAQETTVRIALKNDQFVLEQ